MGSTDKAWQYFGKSDPYFGVLTDESFRRENLDDSSKEAFFATGKAFIESVLGTIRESLDPDFQPKRALDFGCGVGRLAIPIGKLCGSVVGVDIAEGMLEEARRNAAAQGVNGEFVLSDDTLSRCKGPFDFVHSFIVFQHIPPVRGEVILRRLIGLLRDGGVGALHFTYRFEASRPRRLLVRAYRSVPLLYGARNLAKGRPFSEPMMQMNEYDLNRLFSILKEEGAERVHVRFTETGSYGNPFYGVILIFQKTRTNIREFG